MRIARDDHQFQAGSVVAYSQLQLGMGLTFTEIVSDHQKVLRSWIAEPEVTASTAPGAAATAGDTRLRFVMKELITLLESRKAISETERTEPQKHAIR